MSDPLFGADDEANTPLEAEEEQAAHNDFNGAVWGSAVIGIRPRKADIE